MRSGTTWWVRAHWWCIVLHFIVLYYIVLYCTALYWTGLYCTVGKTVRFLQEIFRTKILKDIDDFLALINLWTCFNLGYIRAFENFIFRPLNAIKGVRCSLSDNPGLHIHFITTNTSDELAIHRRRTTWPFTHMKHWIRENKHIQFGILRWQRWPNSGLPLFKYTKHRYSDYIVTDLRTQLLTVWAQKWYVCIIHCNG